MDVFFIFLCHKLRQGSYIYVGRMVDSSPDANRVFSEAIHHDRRLQAVGNVIIRSIVEWQGAAGCLARDLYLDGADVLLCVSGRFRFTLDGVKVMELGVGEALVTYPGHRVTFEALGNENHLFSVVLCGTSVKDYFDSMGFFHGQSGRTSLPIELLARIRDHLDRQSTVSVAENQASLSLMTDALQSMANDFRESR